MKYFYDEHEPFCVDLDEIRERMMDDGLTEKEVYKAERSVGEGFFWCSKYGEAGESSDSGCGEGCKDYEPRNGKNGRCKHSGHCYNYGDKILITN